MPLWFEIVIIILLLLAIVELFGIEGNIGNVANELVRLNSSLNAAFKVNEIEMAKLRKDHNLSSPKS